MKAHSNTEWWAETMDQRRGWTKDYPNENLIRYFKKYLGSIRQQHVLDIGFGTGTDLMSLARAGAECYGIEVSEEVKQRALERFHDEGLNAELYGASHYLYKLDQNNFDFIYSLEALHYLASRQEIERALEQCHRLLRSGGHIVVSMPTPRHFFCKLSESIEGNVRVFDERFEERNGVEFYVIPNEDAGKELFSLFGDVWVGYYEWRSKDSLTNSFWLIGGRKIVE